MDNIVETQSGRGSTHGWGFGDDGGTGSLDNTGFGYGIDNASGRYRASGSGAGGDTRGCGYWNDTGSG